MGWLTDLEDDPTYRRLSYSDQKYALSQIIMDKMQTDPEMQKLSDKDKQIFYRQMLSERPKFENPAFDQQLDGVLQEIQNNPKSGIAQAAGIIAATDYADSNFITRGISKVIDKVGLLGALSLGPTKLNMMGRTPMSLEERYFSNDSEKTVSYLSDMLGTSGKQRLASLAHFTGKALGFGTDFLSTMVTPPLAASRQLASFGLGQAAANIGKTSFKRWLLGSALPSIADNTIDGVLLTARDFMLKKMNGASEEDLWGANKLVTIAKTFGQYALMDYVFGVALNTALPAVKVFRDVRSQKKILDQFPEFAKAGPAERMRIIDTITGKGIPAEFEGKMPELLKVLQKSRELGEDVAKLSPDMLSKDILAQTHNMAMMNGFNFAKLDDGTYTLAQNFEGGIGLRKFDNLYDAQLEVSKAFYNRVNKAGVLENYTSDAKKWYQMYATKLDNDANLNIARKMDGEAFQEVYKARKATELKPIDERGAISSKEAQYMRMDNPEKYRPIELDMDTKTASRIKNGKEVFDNKRPVAVKLAQKDPDALFLANKTATQEDFIRVTQEAQQRIKKLPDVELSDMRRTLMMQEGFDSALSPEGLLEVYTPENIKFITDNINVRTGEVGRLAQYKKGDIVDKGKLRAEVRASLKGELDAQAFAANKKLLVEAAARIQGDVSPSDIKNLSKTYLNGINYEYAPAIEKVARPDYSKMSKETAQTIEENLKKLDQKRASFVAKMDQKEPTIIVRTKSNDPFLNEGNVRITHTGDKIEIIAPSKIEDIKQQKKFVESLYTQLDELGPVKSPQIKNIGQTYERQARKWYGLGDTPLDREQWFQRSLERFNKSSDKKYQVAFKDGSYRLLEDNVEIGSHADLGNTIDQFLVKTYDPSNAKQELADAGYRLLRKGLNYDVVNKAGKSFLGKPVRSIEEALDALDFSPRKLDANIFQDTVILTDEGVKVNIEGAKVLTQKQAAKYFENFEDKALTRQLRKIADKKGAELFKITDSKYQIQIPELGVVEDFATLHEAQEFINKDFEALSNLAEFADKKGFLLATSGENYALYRQGEKILAKNKDEVRQVLKNNPDFNNAVQELVADEQYRDLILGTKFRPEGEVVRPATNAPPDEPIKMRYEARRRIGAMTEPMSDFMEKTVRRSELGDMIYTSWKDLDDALRLAKVRIDETMRVVDDIFSEKHITRSGKVKKNLLSLDRRLTIRAYLEDANFKDILPEDITRAKEIRRLLGENANSGLYATFGLDGNKFLSEYMPRLREHVATASNLNAYENTADLYKRAIGKNNLPKELSWFAEHSRVAEEAQFARELDPYKLVTRYVTKGYKTYYMKQSWNNLREVLASSNVPSFVVQRIERWQEQAMGTFFTKGEEFAAQVSEGFLRGLNNTLPQKLKMDEATLTSLAKDTTSLIYSVNVLTNMGWRPWLPFRNMFQIYTTLGTRFGIDNVNKAVKLAASKEAEGVRNHLIETGLIQNTPPVLDLFTDHKNIVSKLTHKSLGLYKSSDEFTRVVAYMTAKHQFDDAVMKFRKGIITTEKEFVDLSGIRHMPELKQKRIVGLVNQGLEGLGKETITPQSERLLLSALDSYGEYTIAETMFLYQKTNAPEMYHGLIGKMFGQYGTYPVNYFQNVIRGFTNGTAADKALFIARTGAIGLGLYAGFRAVGIQAKNFLPWSPMMFSGGPMYNIGVKAIQSMGNGYEARQARAELLSLLPIDKKDGQYVLQWPRTAPFFYQYRTLRDFLEYSDKGDWYKAWLALTSAPTVPDNDTSFF